MLSSLKFPCRGERKQEQPNSNTQHFVTTTKHATGGCVEKAGGLGGREGGGGGRITRVEDIAFSTEVQNKFDQILVLL